MPPASTDSELEAVTKSNLLKGSGRQDLVRCPLTVGLPSVAIDFVSSAGASGRECEPSGSECVTTENKKSHCSNDGPLRIGLSSD